MWARVEARSPWVHTADGMFRMAVGHSDDIDPEDAAQAIVAQCRQGLGGVAPTAGILFSAYDLEAEPALRAITAAFPGIDLVGTTSVGEMSSVFGYQEDSVTLAAFATDQVDITSGMATDVFDDVGTAAKIAVEQARSKTAKQPRLCVAIPSVDGDAPALLAALRAELGEDVPVLGGGAAPAGPAEGPGESNQFYGTQVLRRSVVLLLFSGPLEFSFGIDTGWHPVGPRGLVTRVENGLVHEIDGRPALAFYERHLGAGSRPALGNPLAVFEPGSDGFYLRAPIAHDPQAGTIRVSGSLPPAVEVQLTMAATDEILDGARSALVQAIDRFPGSGAPDAALLFSCAIRKYLLGTRTGVELDISRDMLGAAVPICGFYSYGEIAPLDDSGGATRFHNETLVAVLLGEQ